MTVQPKPSLKRGRAGAHADTTPGMEAALRVLRMEAEGLKALAASLDDSFAAALNILAGIIAVGLLPIPKSEVPMPLFAFGATYDVGDALWIVGGMSGARLDAMTQEVSPIDEAQIIESLKSFRPPATKK